MPAGERGFSLVEVLVALAIIAAMTGVLVQTVGQDAHIRRTMRERRLALMVAQSALDRTVAGDSADNGRWGDLTWHIERAPYGAVDPLDRAPLEQLTASVTGENHQPLVTLTTVRIRP
jgi:prepilin-type N-terminal cleavage/methylation domain-containing protein